MSITFSINEPLSTLDTLIVPIFSDEKEQKKQLQELDSSVQEALAPSIQMGDCKGKKFESYCVYTDQFRVLVIGLGKRKDFSIRRWKHAIGIATIRAEKNKIEHLGIVIPTFVQNRIDAELLAESTAIAVAIGDYAYDEYQSGEAKPHHISSCTCIGVSVDTESEFESGLRTGAHIGNGVNLTRHLGNTPPSVMTPALLAERSKELEPLHTALSIKVLEREDMKKLGMGCLLGVAQGSELPPKFIIMEFMNGDKEEKPTVLVGKGITFDSGGLSLKPANYMSDMKFDMLGAGTALGVIRAAIAMDMKKNIVVLIPSAENMPSGTSFRPDDVLTAMNGKTIEIGNTDAEGRLILADALSFAAENYDPEIVIDFATLTGACMVALGEDRSGLFTPHDDIADSMYTAATQHGEWIWRLPLGEEYSEKMKSSVADIANISDGPFGGASTAAAFLEFFTKNHETGEALFPWAHFDLSSAFAGKKGKPWRRYGATGDVVQTVLGYLRNT